MSLSHIILALSCLSLLCVIAAQDWLVPSLRNNTISAGLTGPYHVMLDVSYVPLSLTLLVAFTGWMELWATIAAVSLLMVAATNTAWNFFNSITNGEHALWHSRFTIAVFVSAILLQLSGDHGWMWGLTVANVVIPTIAYLLFHFDRISVKGTIIKASPAAEKLFVVGLCIWFIVGAL